ncbi:MAG: hypothetical protein ACRD15_19430 [Vicinamibacterales bacterium]
MNDHSEYVRNIESYLCQKNKGHLIRVVGPAFELVCGWASSGVPLKVAFQGIDRCCARHDARKGRRRPIRIEFCEADVLDAFDEWRRAVGVTAAVSGEPENGAAPARKPALAAHIERAIARLAHARGVDAPSTDFHHHIDRTIRELEQIVPSAIRVRGEARAGIVSRLRELDAALIDAATAGLDPTRAGQLRNEAADELASFRARMPAEARERATRAAFERLVRETSGLPTLSYD